MPRGAAYPPVLSHLNLAREHLRKMPCPVVFWLRDKALTRLAQGAPDFWAWRSGVYEFLPEAKWAESVYQQPRGGTRAWSELPPAKKSQRMLTLEGLLADYRELGDGPTERNIRAELLLELGRLYLRSYRTEAATSHLTEALDLYRVLGDRLGEAHTLQALACLEHQRENFFEQAIYLHQAIGDVYSHAKDCAQWADTWIALALYDEAKVDLKFALQVYISLNLPYVDWVKAKLAE